MLYAVFIQTIRSLRRIDYDVIGLVRWVVLNHKHVTAATKTFASLNCTSTIQGTSKSFNSSGDECFHQARMILEQVHLVGSELSFGHNAHIEQLLALLDASYWHALRNRQLIPH